MGFPDWETVESWIDGEENVIFPEEEKEKEIALKNPGIPKLDNYEDLPEDGFWKYFPKREMPEYAETKIDVGKLEECIEKVRGKMKETELKRALKVLADLRSGADAYQRKDLPPIKTQNAKSAFENGQLITDIIATWIEKGFVLYAVHLRCHLWKGSDQTL